MPELLYIDTRDPVRSMFVFAQGYGAWELPERFRYRGTVIDLTTGAVDLAALTANRD